MPDFEIVGVDARWGKCFLQNFTQLSADDESLVIFFVLVREGQGKDEQVWWKLNVPRSLGLQRTR